MAKNMAKMNNDSYAPYIQPTKDVFIEDPSYHVLTFGYILPSSNLDMAKNRILKGHDIERPRSLIGIDSTIGFLDHAHI